jgi:hypothetical protein
VVLLAFMLGASSAHAFWFKGEEPSEPEAAAGAGDGEVLVATLSEEQASQFLQLAAARIQTDRQITVLAELREEKLKEIASFESNLERNFSVNATNTYHYDRSTYTVYLLESAPAASTNAAAGDAEGDVAEPTGGETLRKTVWKELSRQEGEAFERILSAKQIAATQLQSINLLLREKGLERRRTQEILKVRFGIDPTLHYRYDRDTRTLYRSNATSKQ